MRLFFSISFIYSFLRGPELPLQVVQPYQTILNDPILLGIAIILSAMVVYSILKKLFKIAVILVACVVVYIGWLAYTGQPVPETLDELIDDVNQRTDGATEKIIDKTSEAVKDGIEIIKDKTK